MADQITTTPNVSGKVKMDGLSSDILNKPVEIDEIVKDANAYRIWQKFEESPYLTIKRFFEASDGGIIDLAIVHPYLKKKIAHLPQDEQDKIWVLKTEKYQPARLLANQWKKKAFGVIPGPKKQQSDDPKKQKAYENASIARFAMVVPRTKELIELFGRMFTIDEVFQVVVEDWGLPANKKMLAEFRNHYAEIIADKITHHKRSFADLRLGIKKSRLEELCWIYAELKADYRKNRQVKYIEQMRMTLQDIRKEIEGDKVVVEGNLDINIEADINFHLNSEVLRNIGLRNLIIGRVAARMNMNPNMLVYFLTKSYYAKFGGVVEAPAEDIEYENLRYPNEAGYDFDMIAKSQAALSAEVDAVEPILEALVTPTEGNKLRERLLSIARAKTHQLEQDKTVANLITPTIKLR